MLKYAPTNEQGVICLFAIISKRLGYFIRRIQTEFPDCILVDEHGNLRRCEFEYLTSNFCEHSHQIKNCDLVVAWEDDIGLASKVPVIELKKYFPDLQSDPDIAANDLKTNKTLCALGLIEADQATSEKLTHLFKKYHPKERRKEPERLVARLIVSGGAPFVEGRRLRLGHSVERNKIVWSVSRREKDIKKARNILIELGLSEFCSE